MRKKISIIGSTIEVIGYADMFKDKLCVSIYNNGADLPEVENVVFCQKIDLSSDYYIFADPVVMRGSKIDSSILQQNIFYTSENKEKKDALIIIITPCPIGFIQKMCSTYKGTKIVYSPDLCSNSNYASFRYTAWRNRPVGGSSEEAVEDFCELFSFPTFKGSLGRMSIAEAELCATFFYAFVDIKTAISNEIVRYCNRESISAKRVLDFINLTCSGELKGSTGIGGNRIASANHYLDGAIKVLEAARKVNFGQVQYWKKRIVSIIKTYDAKRVLICGASNGSNSIEMDNSPSYALYASLKKTGSDKLDSLILWDPLIDKYSFLPDISNFDLFVITVDHNSFVDLFDAIPEGKIVVDCCGSINSEKLKKKGCRLYGYY